jgi:hypothetical protein
VLIFPNTGWLWWYSQPSKSPSRLDGCCPTVLLLLPLLLSEPALPTTLMLALAAVRGPAFAPAPPPKAALLLLLLLLATRLTLVLASLPHLLLLMCRPLLAPLGCLLLLVPKPFNLLMVFVPLLLLKLLLLLLLLLLTLLLLPTLRMWHISGAGPDRWRQPMTATAQATLAR